MPPIRSLVFLALLTGASLFAIPDRLSARPSAFHPPNLVLAYGERPYKMGNYPSPDGKYVLRVFHPDTHTNVELRAAGSKAKLVGEECVTGFMWAPRHPHRLIVSTSGVYGNASLVAWESGRAWRHLARAKKPGDEYFRLFGASPDGKSIFYSHAILDADDFQEQVEARLRVSVQAQTKRKP